MEKTSRTFLAVKIIPESKFLKIYSLVKNVLEGEVIKWIDQNNFHLTLRFLGETNQIQTEKVKQTLENIAVRFNSFDFCLKGIGYFKSRGNPKVLFLKIEKSQVLKQIADELNQQAVKLGYEEETREFKPHLTLGRIKFIKDKNKFYSLVKKFEETKIQRVNVSEIIFYQSILKPSGAIYRPIKTVQLNP